jgi:hypothetical protein
MELKRAIYALWTPFYFKVMKILSIILISGVKSTLFLRPGVSYIYKNPYLVFISTFLILVVLE